MKKNKKKNHRSKASRKRKAACKGRAPVSRISVSSVEDIERVDMINEAVHTYRTTDLGSQGTMGPVSMSLAVYLSSIRGRVLGGEQMKPNLFIQFGYSCLSMDEFLREQVMHASGGFNFPTMAIAMADGDGLSDLILQIEEAIRDTVAVLNENNEQAVKIVNLKVAETDEEQNPHTAFGFPYGAEGAETVYEREVSFSL